jgi:hypothetical protein
MTRSAPTPKKGPWASVFLPPAIIGWYEVKGPNLFDSHRGSIVWRFWNGSGWEWCFPLGGKDGPRRSTLLTAAHSWRGTL